MLNQIWWENFVTDSSDLADEPDKAYYLLGTLTDREALKMPGFMIDDPDWEFYTWDVLSDEDISEIRNRELAEGFFNFSGETGSLSISEIELGGNLIAKSDCAKIGRAH